MPELAKNDHFTPPGNRIMKKARKCKMYVDVTWETDKSTLELLMIACHQTSNQNILSDVNCLLNQESTGTVPSNFNKRHIATKLSMCEK